MKEINLMLIDDDPINLYIFNKITLKTGVPVKLKSCSNGKVALLELIQSLKHNKPLPDIIFVDISMPVLNGWEFLHLYEQLQITQDIPMFILTSSILPTDEDKAAQFKRIKGFIRKPISKEQLKELLESVLSDAKS
ncbi:Receiver protein of a two-component response regulator [Pedobacter sp. BAL39]|uniref:response regulator n=1 Tax=Pedobacter sp. BAL39 TaxID=391596 RepID=UPI0001559AF1|nr:response regulator [Pedobacter sp. BAL39]EDM36511.1 Receiver protein of a two-component response regulator [Pedobacter sp. BAL39]